MAERTGGERSWTPWRAGGVEVDLRHPERPQPARSTTPSGVTAGSGRSPCATSRPPSARPTVTPARQGASGSASPRPGRAPPTPWAASSRPTRPRSPVLHLTGQIDSRFLGQRKGFIHEVPDQLGHAGVAVEGRLRAGVGRRDGAKVVGRAAAQAMACPRGPVSVEIPIDFQYASSRGSRPQRQSPSRVRADRRPATPTAPRSPGRPSSSPVPRDPSCGRAAAPSPPSAGDEVAALVRRLGAGSLTSPNGRGIVSEDDPCCIGNLSWDQGVRELCREADLLVAIGTRFQGPNTENWRMELPGHLVHIDVDPGVPGRNYPVEVGHHRGREDGDRGHLGRAGQPERGRAGPRSRAGPSVWPRWRRRRGSAFAKRSGRK